MIYRRAARFIASSHLNIARQDRRNAGRSRVAHAIKSGVFDDFAPRDLC